MQLTIRFLSVVECLFAINVLSFHERMQRIIFHLFRRLYSCVSRKTPLKSNFKYVIIDDTDLPKVRFVIEENGKVFSYT